MNRRRIGKIGAILYTAIYAAAMIVPRSQANEDQSSTHQGSITRFLHSILYYSGPLEPLANFLFLIPIFVFLIFLLGSSKSALALSICIALSLSAELLQRLIPGRVSSLQDFVLNCLGALTAFLMYRLRSLRLNHNFFISGISRRGRRRE